MHHRRNPWRQSAQIGHTANSDSLVAEENQVKFELYKSAQNSQWYWRMVADNGRTIAIGGEGYQHRNDAVGGLQLVRANAAGAICYEQRPDGTWFIPP